MEIWRIESAVLVSRMPATPYAKCRHSSSYLAECLTLKEINIFFLVSSSRYFVWWYFVKNIDPNAACLINFRIMTNLSKSTDLSFVRLAFDSDLLTFINWLAWNAN